MNNEIDAVSKHLLMKKNQNIENVECYQIPEISLKQYFFKLFYELKREETVPNSSHGTSSILLPNLESNNVKENDRPIFQHKHNMLTLMPPSSTN